MWYHGNDWALAALRAARGALRACSWRAARVDDALLRAVDVKEADDACRVAEFANGDRRLVQRGRALRRCATPHATRASRTSGTAGRSAALGDHDVDLCAAPPVR